MTIPLSVLIVEDREDDALLLVRQLRGAGYRVTHERVDTAMGVEDALARRPWDLVISDHGMPAFSGTEALALVRRVDPDVPFIFVSGSISEDAAVDAMRAGAQDYVMKGSTRRLLPAIGRELRDVEGRRRERSAETRLRATTEMLRSVVAASPLAIIATDLAGLVKLWNPAAERLFGWTEADVLGKDNPTVPVDAQEERQARRARALRGEAFMIVEARRQRKDGSLVEVSVSIAATNGEDGRPDGLIIVLQDLTDRKQLEAQFLQAQKMEAVGRLAGGVAHDFNNLLTVIMSYIDLMLTDLPAKPAKEEDLREVRKAADAATALTRQLLSFSRQKTIQPRVVELNAVVHGATSLLTRLIGENVALRAQLDPAAGLVRIDAGQLEQIIMNLAVNARDAMPEGGELLLETWRAAATDLPVTAPPGRSRNYSALSVRDTGTGMDAATRARIFEPFFTTKAPDKGTGLGLATVYGIVKQYDGAVRVESAPGAGTTFTIYLPSARQGSVSPVGIAAVVDPKRARSTILLVEDEPAVRAVARRVLEQAGYAVLEAPDAQVAARLAETRADGIQLLLTDVMLPGMDGVELATRVVAKRAGLKVLFMSGLGEDSEALSRLRKSGHGLLRKPFQPEALVDAVRRLLE